MKTLERIKEISTFIENNELIGNSEIQHLGVFDTLIVLKVKHIDGSEEVLKISNDVLNRKIKPDEHVYCTNCIRGENLVLSLLNDNEPCMTPYACTKCNPYNLEDSSTYNERPQYIEKDVLSTTDL